MGKKWNTLPGAPVPTGKGKPEGLAREGGPENLAKSDTSPPKVARPGGGEGKVSTSGSDKGNARPGGNEKLR